MSTTGKLKIMIVTIALALVCGTVNAQPRRWYHRPHKVVTVVSRPAVTIHVSNLFTQMEVLAWLFAYLQTHEYLTINK